MLIENVYYSEKPKRVYVYPYDGQRMCRADFPVNVREEDDQYLCDVYSLKTTYTDSLLEDIESNYKEWLERAKEYEEPRKRLLMRSARLTASSDDTSTTFIDLSQTIYGGTLDVVTGELVVDRAMIASYAGEAISEPWLSSMDEYSAGATPTTGAQVVYPITPQTYQLTPTEVKTLLGANNVWADAGTVEVTYTANLKDYLAKIMA